MWYEKLLQKLIVSKIDKTEHASALKFLHVFLKDCCWISAEFGDDSKKDNVLREPVPPQVILLD